MFTFLIALARTYLPQIPRVVGERGGVSVEWIALAAAAVVILGAVAATQADPISNAIESAIDSILTDASDISGGD